MVSFLACRSIISCERAALFGPRTPRGFRQLTFCSPDKKGNNTEENRQRDIYEQEHKIDENESYQKRRFQARFVCDWGYDFRRRRGSVCC